MIRKFTLTLASALALGLGAVACGERATAPQLDLAGDDLEAVLLETVGIAEGQANVSSAVPASSRMDVASTSAAAHGTCSFSAETGRFTCPDIVRNGVTISRSYALYDAAGASQARRDSGTTSINTRVWARGTVTGDSSTSTIDRRSDLTTSGVQPSSASRTLNGTEQGSLSLARITSRGRVLSTTTFADTIIGLVVPQRDTARGWPLAGTVIRNHHGTKTLEGTSHSRSFSRRSVFVYDGSATVQITITADGQTRTCTRNMATREHHCG